MTNYKQLCAELLQYWDAAGTPSDFIDTNGYGTIQRIRAALAKSESSGDVTGGKHPITPPPELVVQWRTAASNFSASLSTDHGGRRDYIDYIATQATRWGADQELEACINAIFDYPGFEHPELFVEILRAARRPKPPSLKEQALAELELLRGDANTHGLGFDAPAIRRALESLPS